MQKINNEILFNTQTSNDVKNTKELNVSQNTCSISFQDMVNSSSKGIESFSQNDFKSDLHDDSNNLSVDKGKIDSHSEKTENIEKKNEKSEKIDKKYENTVEENINNKDENDNLEIKKSQLKDKKNVVFEKNIKSDDKKTLKDEKKVNNKKNMIDSSYHLSSKISQFVLKNETVPSKNNSEGKIKSITSEKKSNTKYLDYSKKITVTDLRTDKNVNSNVKKMDNKLNFDVKFTNDNSATINLNYSSANQDFNINGHNIESNNLVFQNMLNNSIQENIPEFVKTGSMILRDNDQGTINLVLHPEDLGNVKIHLSLDGKTVSGHIIVATKEALEVFKDNAQTLREAFKQNGFENAEFNVSYNNSNSSFGQNSSGNFDTNEFFAKQAYDFKGEVEISKSEGIMATNSDKKSEYSINIVA